MMKKKRSISAAVAAAGVVSISILSGCAGPSTRVLPREILAEQEYTEKMPVLEEANPFTCRSHWSFCQSFPGCLEARRSMGLRNI